MVLGKSGTSPGLWRIKTGTVTRGWDKVGLERMGFGVQDRNPRNLKWAMRLQQD